MKARARGETRCVRIASQQTRSLTDDIRLPFSRWEKSVSFEPRAGRVSPRQTSSLSGRDPRLCCSRSEGNVERSRAARFVRRAHPPAIFKSRIFKSRIFKFASNEGLTTSDKARLTRSKNIIFGLILKTFTWFSNILGKNVKYNRNLERNKK